MVYREDRLGGVKKLWWRVFDFKRIENKLWYIPVIFLMPILLLSYAAMRLLGMSLPEPDIPYSLIPVYPNYGSHYDPMVTGVLTALAAVMVIMI